MGAAVTTATFAGEDLYSVLQAMIREELARFHVAEIGEVTELHSHEAENDKNNYQVSVSLRDSGLLLPKVSVATQRIGTVAIPNVGDLVLVQFIGGDIHRPVITGRLYNDVDRPPVANAGEWVYETRDAAEAELRRLQMTLPNDNSITIDDDQAVVTIGDASLVMENSGKITISSATDITLKADGNIVLEAGGDLSMDAGGAFKAEAGSDFSAKGLSLALQAQTSAKLEGGADATLKGTAVTIAGMTNFSAG